MKKLLYLAISLLIAITAFADVPQGFNYQAIIRDAEGTPLIDQNVAIRLSLKDHAGKTIHFTETHNLTTAPNGLVNLTVGQGDNPDGNFSDVPWEQGNISIKIEVDPQGGTNFTDMGSAKLMSVPYALYAGGDQPNGLSGSGIPGRIAFWTDETTLANLEALQFNENIELISAPDAADDDPIFEVKNREGKVVFGVYQTGVRIYVEDSGGKGRRSGFAVGGLSDQTKESGVEFFRLTPDSVRFNINMPSDGKGRRSGFAVGGLSDQTKGVPVEYFTLAPDNVRFNISTPTDGKGRRSGFAVGGLSDQTKETSYNNLLFISPDSARIYVDSSPEKGRRSGFAVGGLSDQTKNQPGYYLNLTPENYLIGQGAGESLTTGEYNSFMGYEAGKSTTEGTNNIFIGFQSGYSNIGNSDVPNYGSFNVFLGNQSGYSNYAGGYNTFLGYQAGYSNQYANYNSFIGFKAGFGNTAGSFNTFMGYQAGHENTTGNSNVFIGHDAGYNNLSGVNSVYIGKDAGLSATNAHNNVFIGQSAGHNFDGTFGNVFIGQEAALGITDGFQNLIVGYRAASQPASETFESFGNVLLGPLAGRRIDGNFNVMIGKSAGENYQLGGATGESNVFMGTYAGQHATGNNNIYIGYAAGRGQFDNVNPGNNNIFIGSGAGIHEKGSERLHVGSGGYGTLIYGSFTEGRVGILNTDPTEALDVNGRIRIRGGSPQQNMVLRALNDDGTASWNFLDIANTTGTLSVESGGTGRTALTQHAVLIGNGTNAVIIQNSLRWVDQKLGIMIPVEETPQYELDVNGFGRIAHSVYLATDGTNRRVGIGTKTPGGVDVKVDIVGGHARIQSDYEWLTNSDKRYKSNIMNLENSLAKVTKLSAVTYNNNSKQSGSKAQIGLIAQELEEQFPELVFTDENGYKSVAYGKVGVILIEAIKEQQEQIQTLKEQNTNLEEKLNEMDVLKAEIEAIKAILNQ